MSSPDATIGYITVVDQERTGWTGGLLILSRGGRPLEFQCTLPVRPSKAHTILFGPSLRDHLIADVITPVLIKRVRTKISIIAVDQPETLRLAETTDVPVVLVVDAAEAAEGPIGDEELAGWPSIEFSGATVRCTPEDEPEVRRLAQQMSDLPDAAEPFGRITQAIAEAHSQIARGQINQSKAA